MHARPSAVHLGAKGSGDLELLTAALTATATATSWAAVRGTQRALRKRAAQARLAQLEVMLPLEVDHLPPRLQALVRGARSARRVLETPVSRVLAASSWSYADFDRAVTDARRTLWEWMCGLRGLDATDYALLRELRLDPRPLRGLLYAPGVFERGEDVFSTTMPAPDVVHVVDNLCTAIEHLRRFEVALLSYRPDPYR